MPRRRSLLSQDKIFAAALVLVDEGGLEALSMRKLAGSLGVEAMSLYNHVPSKAALVTALVDFVFADLQLPPFQEDWRDWVRRLVLDLWSAGMAHPSLVPAIVGGQALGSELLRLVDGLFERLTLAGLSLPDQVDLWELLKNQLFGALSQVDASPADPAVLVRHPHLLAVAREGGCRSLQECFERSVRFILDGFPSRGGGEAASLGRAALE